MNERSRKQPRKQAPSHAPSQAPSEAPSQAPSTLLSRITFVCYCIFTVDYFLRVSTKWLHLDALRPTLVLFGLIIMLLLAQHVHLKGRLATSTAKAFFALLIYILLSLPFTTWPGSVIRNFEPFMRAAAFFFLTALTVDTETRLYVFLTVFVGCQLFRVLDPLFLHITTGYLGDETYLGDGDFAGRLSGAPFDVVNPNGLGFVTVACVPFLYYCLFGARQLYRKALAVALICACVYVVYLTLSRGAMVALLVIVWMIFRRTKRKALFVTAVAIIAVVGWAHLGGVNKDRYMSLLGGHAAAGSVQATENQTAMGRVQVTEEEFQIGMERPIFGHGLGTTAEAKVHNGHGPQASHNLYTELLVEIGVVGAFFFLRFLYSIWVSLRGVERAVAADKERSPDDIQRRLVQCFVALFWMYVVFSANYFGLSQDYWFALAGMVTAFARQIRPVTAERPAVATGRSYARSGVQRLRSLYGRPKIGTR